MRKRYKVEFKKGEADHSFFGISLHSRPAIKRAMHFYSEDVKTEVYGDAEEGIIVGPIMIPNLPIPRKGEDGEIVEYVFDEEAISNAMFDMTTGGHFNRFTVEHEDQTFGVNITEFWQKESDEDKSNKYGYSDLPVGTAFIKAHVADEELKTLIRDGVLQGFSVELDHGIQPTNNYEEVMTQEELDKAVEARIAAMKEKEEAERKIEEAVQARLAAEAEAKAKAEEEAKAAAEAKAIEAAKAEEKKKEEEEAAAKAAAEAAEAQAKKDQEEEATRIKAEEEEKARLLAEQSGSADEDDEDKEDPRKVIAPKYGTAAYKEWEDKMRGVASKEEK